MALPWAVFTRRPNADGLVCPLGRRAPISTHHGGALPRRPLLRVRSDHDIPDWVVAWTSREPPTQ